jgi:hypothetical protein
MNNNLDNEYDALQDNERHPVVGNKIGRIVSSISSKIMMILVLVYLFIKTLVNPVFTSFDIEIARATPGYWNYDWLNIICGSSIYRDFTYLPEARADLLFELGLYFPKEK